MFGWFVLYLLEMFTLQYASIFTSTDFGLKFRNCATKRITRDFACVDEGFPCKRRIIIRGPWAN